MRCSINDFSYDAFIERITKHTKDNLVEVGRCRNCKHRSNNPVNGYVYMSGIGVHTFWHEAYKCKRMANGCYVDGNDYCSYWEERKKKRWLK